MLKNSKLAVLLLFTISLVISGCGKKSNPAPNSSPTPAPKLIELPSDQKPYIKLTPRQDGHELTLVIANLPEFITQIEYELLYTAQDNGLEIEKGVGDTIKLEKPSPSIEWVLLLGTSSCTNGCKYKYDTGVNGGNLSLIFYTQTNQAISFETPFRLVSSSELKKNQGLSLPDNSFSIKATVTGQSDYYVLLRNFGAPKNTEASALHSVFSSGAGIGKVISVNPDTFIKKDATTLVGDYLQN